MSTKESSEGFLFSEQPWLLSCGRSQYYEDRVEFLELICGLCSMNTRISWEGGYSSGNNQSSL